MRLLFILIMLLAVAAPLRAQSERPELRVGVLAGELRLDGIADEPQWQAADSIAELTEIEPEEGGTAVGRTVVRVLANGRELVIAIRAEDPEPGGIISYSRHRDAELESEDHVRIVLDTFLDGRTGYVFAVNPGGARYDALIGDRGENQNRNWDAVWEAATHRNSGGWSAEIRIPAHSLSYRPGLRTWGLNVQRRVQRLQELSRWASPERDYELTQMSRSGLLLDVPEFELGLGLSVRPAVTGALSRLAPDASVDRSSELSLDATQKLGSGAVASLTINTDFAETEVDTRQTNLTRFPLFFPEKRTFFLEGSEIFEFGLGLSNGGRGRGGFGGGDLLPFFSRRIGLLEGREVPVEGGGKLNGTAGSTNFGALVVRTGDAPDAAPATTLGAVRIKQNLLRESSAGAMFAFGDPQGRSGAWLAGADFVYQTSRFRGDKNFLAGVWGLAAAREGLAGDRTTYGFKIDYPNDLWDVSLTYKRIGDGFDPSLGFVPRRGVQITNLGISYRPRPERLAVRQLFFGLHPRVVTDLRGKWETYRVFVSPLHIRLESGDRVELGLVPQGDRPLEPFEVAEGVTVQPGTYQYTRYRVEAQTAAKRRLSARASWWFGDFYDGSLRQVELEATWNPWPLLTLEASAERSQGSLPAGDFTVDLLGLRVQGNLSPNLGVSSFVQYDTESGSVGSNTRLRWTYHPLGDLFLVYNHSLRELERRWAREAYQFSLKVQHALRF